MSATSTNVIDQLGARPNATNEEIALRFARDALTFSNAAKSLDDFRMFGPRYYLLRHAIELVLKSYILASGGDQSELGGKRGDRRSLGHNLTKALKRANALGFVPAEKDLKLFVDWLNPYHRNHEFRYPKRGFKRVPTADDVIRGITFRASKRHHRLGII